LANGHTEIVTLLLNQGADVNIRDRKGETPLMRTAAEGQLGLVTMLIEKGADVNAQATKGETALMYAEWYGRCQVAAQSRR